MRRHVSSIAVDFLRKAQWAGHFGSDPAPRGGGDRVSPAQLNAERDDTLISAEGFIGEDMFFYVGPGALRRARLARQILEERCASNSSTAARQAERSCVTRSTAWRCSTSSLTVPWVVA
jgi:hypothetical protein